MSPSFRGDVRSAAIAVAAALFVSAAPAVADHVASYARRAGKVDGRDAVGSGASAERRAGSLVAANPSGRLPGRVLGIPPNSKQVGGLSASQLVRASKARRKDHIDRFSSRGWASVHSHGVTAPTDGVLLVWGQFSAEWDDDSAPGSFAGLGARLTVDERVAGQPQIVEIDRSTRAGTRALVLSAAVPVEKGSHLVRIQARRMEGEGLTYLRPRQTITLFVPFGDDGIKGRL